MKRQNDDPAKRLDYLDGKPTTLAARALINRGICPGCRRALVCTAFILPTEPDPTATWGCRCGFSVTMPKAHRLYRRARLERGDTPADGRSDWRMARGLP